AVTLEVGKPEGVLACRERNGAALHGKGTITVKFTQWVAVYGSRKAVIGRNVKSVLARHLYREFMLDIDKEVILIADIAEFGVTETAFVVQVQIVHHRFFGEFNIARLMNVGDLRAIFDDGQVDHRVYVNRRDAPQNRRSHHGQQDR